MLRSIYHCRPKDQPDHRTREQESESTTATISTRVLLIGLALLCGACSTELKVKRLQTGCDALNQCNAPEQGWIYSLPYVRYKVSIVRTLLEKCDKDKGTINFDVSATATPVFEPDPSQTFVIDNDSLSNWLKTSDLSIERHDNGMLKTIGTSSDDMTGKLIVNTVTGIIKLAEAGVITAATPGTLPLRPDESPTEAAERILKERELNQLREDLCKRTEKKRKIAAELQAKRSALNNAKDDLDAETKRLKFLADAVATFGKAPADQIQKDLVTQAGIVANRQIELGKKQADLQSAIDSISDVHTFTWPKNGTTLEGTPEYSATKLINQFLDPPGPRDNVNIQTLTASLSTNADVKLRIRAPSALALSPGPDGQLPTVAIGDDAKGIRYRAPVPGALEISLCKDVSADISKEKGTESCPDDALHVALLAEGPVPQLGRIMLVPFTNGPFQSNTMEASFTNDGNLQTAAVAEKVSRAEVASDTFNQVAGALLQGVKDIRTAGIDTQTAVLKAKTNQLLAQKDHEKAVLGLQPSGTEANDREIAILASDTALKDALRANIEASLALEKAQAAQQAQ